MAVEITIDCNSDQVVIGFERDVEKADITIDKPRNMHQLQELIYEIVNAIQPLYGKSIGVKLTKIDEDTRTTIDEW